MPVKECLNIGCGNHKYSNAVNIDITYIKGSVEPDVVADAVSLPFEDETFKNIVASHVLEHIARENHWRALSEWRRVLVPKGKLILSLPEFDVCLQNYLDNYCGNREYWYLTIFGAKRYEGDAHLSGLTQNELTELLFNCGFSNLSWNRTHRELACMGVVAIKSEKIIGRLQ